MGPIAAGSVAVIFWLTSARAGAFLTVILRVRDAFSFGEPLSVATIVTVTFGDEPVAIQVKLPLDGSIAAPLGAPGPSVNVRVCPGFGSVACTITDSF